MRNLTLARLWALAAAGLFLQACAGPQKPKDTPLETELELAYDEGPPSERPLLPPPAFEWLVKFEPNLPSYKPLRLRLLLAQPGPLRLAIYAADPAGRPGALLRTIERTYAPELTSGGRDGKWVIETLGEIPSQQAPLFVGISVPAPGNESARLWAAARPSAQLFQRDAEPDTALQSSRLPLTPLLRLALTPTTAPAAPAPSAEPAKTAPAPLPKPEAPPPAASAPPAPTPALPEPPQPDSPPGPTNP